LEGWSADVVGCLGGEKRITPNFDSLSKEGYLFDHFYAS
jgi:phosphoglycerol transferase MdoB-like AlkP superfamily enzyme